MDYTIQPGDTLSQIAQRFGTTVQALAQANGIANPNMIRAGATLQIPGVSVAPTAAPVANGPAPMPLPNPARTGQPAIMGAPGKGAFGSVAGNFAGTGVQSMPARPGDGPKGIGASAPMPLPNPTRMPQQMPGNGVGVQTAPVSSQPLPQDMWQGQQGRDYAAQTQMRGAVPLTNNDIPDPRGINYQQMAEFENRWLSAGRRREELPAWWQQARELRRAQFDLEREMAQREAQQVQQQQVRENPPVVPQGRAGPLPQAAPIGEGEYLPQEQQLLMALQGNMNQAPTAVTGPQTPFSGSLSYTPQTAQIIRQLLMQRQQSQRGVNPELIRQLQAGF